jgi:hypothetical protein
MEAKEKSVVEGVLLIPLCAQCRCDADEKAPAGPVLVNIEGVGPCDLPRMSKMFCSWDCAAQWFAREAFTTDPLASGACETRPDATV